MATDAAISAYYSARARGYALLADGERDLARAERLEPYGSDVSGSIAHHELMAAEYAKWAAYWAALASGSTREEAGIADLLRDRPSHETAAPESI